MSSRDTPQIYSLGVLIVLLLVFWNSCKGLNNSCCSSYRGGYPTMMRRQPMRYPVVVSQPQPQSIDAVPVVSPSPPPQPIDNGPVVDDAVPAVGGVTEGFQGYLSDFTYGSTPIKFSETPLSYLSMDKNNVSQVPNSATAYRHLFNPDYTNTCGLDTKVDKDYSSIQMKKQAQRNGEGPASATSDRILTKTDLSDRLGMSSF